MPVIPGMSTSDRSRWIVPANARALRSASRPPLATTRSYPYRINNSASDFRSCPLSSAKRMVCFELLGGTCFESPANETGTIMPVLLAKSPLRTDQPGPKSTGPLGSSGFYGPVQLYDIKGAHRMDL